MVSYGILYCVTLRCVALCCVMYCYVVLDWIGLFCNVLYCAVLCCAVLCCASGPVPLAKFSTAQRIACVAAGVFFEGGGGQVKIEQRSN